MVTEIAYIEIELADAGAFEEAVASCVPLFLAARGCRTVTLARVVENPAKYRLLVEWDTVDDHMVHFRDSAAFQTWRETAGRFFVRSPQVEHLDFETANQPRV
jgi:quinol monooxygenase YgiN